MSENKHSKNKNKIDLKINLISEQNITHECYEKIQEYVALFSHNFSEKYPNFILTSFDLNIYNLSNNNLSNLSNNNFLFKEENINFIHNKKNIFFTDDEKIYLSKEKIKKIKLNEAFEELKLRPIDNPNMSIIGETYRQIKDDFIKKIEKNIK